MYHDEVCGACYYHKKDDYIDDWICTCPDSENNGTYTDYRATCDKFDSREDYYSRTYEGWQEK